MAKPFSMDLRERLFASVVGGASCHATSDQFAVSVSSVVKLMERHRLDGTIAPRPFGVGRRPALEPHYDRIRVLVAEAPDLTIDELLVRLTGEGIKTSRSTLGRCLLALGLTRKKRPDTRPSRHGRMSRAPVRPGTTLERI